MKLKVFMWLLMSSTLLACSTLNKDELSQMEAFALCGMNDEVSVLETQIKAEYGFRMSKNTDMFKPVVRRTVFGHEVRLLSFDQFARKTYIDGSFQEMKYHLLNHFPEMTCEGRYCEYERADAMLTLTTNGIKHTALVSCHWKD